MSPILFVPLSKGNLMEMLPVADGLKQQGVYEPIFCLGKKVAHLASLTEDSNTVSSDGTVLRASTSQEPSHAKQSVHRTLPPLIQGWMQMRSECKRARKLLNTFSDAALIIVSGDRSIGLETAVIREGNKRKIPSLIVPFAMSFREAAAEPRLRSGKNGGQYAVDTLLKKILRTLFPQWVFIYKNTPLFFQPPYTALAAYLLGIMPKKPWIIGGGAARKMAVESAALRDQLLAQGMDADKMIVTGKPSLDHIASTLTKKREPQNQKAILCSVPNFGEHDLLPWDEHEKEMRFLFDVLKQTGANVVLNLHPRSDKKWYKPLADDAGLTISDKRIYELLPEADIVISSYSSVIAQAIALQKPSVVIDFYGFDYPVYDNAPGTAIITQKEDLLPHFKKLIEDENFYGEQQQKQYEHGSDWALLDGNCTKRVLELIDTMTT